MCVFERVERVEHSTASRAAEMHPAGHGKQLSSVLLPRRRRWQQFVRHIRTSHRILVIPEQGGVKKKQKDTLSVGNAGAAGQGNCGKGLP